MPSNSASKKIKQDFIQKLSFFETLQGSNFAIGGKNVTDGEKKVA